MLRPRAEAESGKGVEWAILRLDDGMLYDHQSGVFSPKPAAGWLALAESPGIPGLYLGSASYPAIPDGWYVYAYRVKGGKFLSSQDVLIRSADDRVSYVAAASGPAPKPPVPPVVVNGGFEEPVLAPGAYTNAKAIPGWTGDEFSRHSANKSDFTGLNPDFPEGKQGVAIKMLGWISQKLDFPESGRFVVAFKFAQRGWQRLGHDFEVRIDDAPIVRATSIAITYSDFFTPAFAVEAGEHALTFAGINSAGGDNATLIDDVRILPAS